MKPDKHINSDQRWKQGSIRTSLFVLGLVFALFCSFVPRQVPPKNTEIGHGWLTPSATAMERLAVYQDANDPNNDLHLSVRKQTKVKCVKKVSQHALQGERAASDDDSSNHFIAGFASVKRPAYYIFLFRYTLF